MRQLEILIKICDEVSRFIQDNYYSARAKFLKQYDYINVSGDLQKGIDDIVNGKIIDLLKMEGLPAVIISEETGILSLNENPTYFLLLDPIDGSNNVRPWFTPCPNLVISMGIGTVQELADKGLDAVETAVVREIFSNNCYYSVRGKGAFYKNNHLEYKLSASTLKTLDSPVIGLDLDKTAAVGEKIIDLISRKILVRRLGSSILDLCQLAAGQYDAYISPGNRLKITDVCQPYALVKEAGGIMEVIPSFKNEVFYGNFLYECLRDPGLLNDIRFKVIAAGNKELLEEIKKYI